MDVLLALVLGMVVNLEGTLRSHEIGIGLRVVVSRHLLSIQGETYYCSHIVLSAMHAILNKFVKSLIFAVKIVCRQIEPIHVLLAPRQVLRRHIVSRMRYFRG